MNGSHDDSCGTASDISGAVLSGNTEPGVTEHYVEQDFADATLHLESTCGSWDGDMQTASVSGTYGS